MAWGTKYQHTGCTEDGTPEIILIAEEDWAGGITEVEAGPSPFIKTSETTTESKFDPLRPTTATVTLVCDEEFDLEFLWTADERKYRVERWLDGELSWRGFIIPNGFSYNYRGGLYYATITASDSLATLDNVPFLSESGQQYGLVDLTFNNGNRYPFILIITECLRKLDLDLDTWTCVGIRESRMPITGGREADPLAYSTVDVRTYINDTQRDDIPYWQDLGAVWDCGRVLRNALTIWGAKLYQENGSWRVKYINDDAAPTARQWRKYNTAAVYIGQEAVAENIAVQCEDDVLVNASHVMAMDRVFAQVRVNYKYTFLREGDSPENLIANGNLNWPAFALFPPEWLKRGNLRIERAPKAGIVDIYGIMDPGKPSENAKMVSRPFDISQGDNIIMSWWQKAAPIFRTSGAGTVALATFGIYLITIRRKPDTNERYYLVWDGGSGVSQKYTWVESSSPIYVQMQGYPDPDTDFWTKVKPEIPPAPISGEFFIDIYGKGSYYGEFIDFSPGDTDIGQHIFPARGYVPGSDPLTIGPTNLYAVDDQYGPLSVSEFFAGLIKNISSEEVPKIHPYLYPEVPRQRYTDRNDPIEIFNGDTVDVDHVSSIQVEGVTGKLYWDTWDGKYGYSSLGLLLARSIAEQYWLPNRILEGDFQHPDMTLNSRISLDFLPDVTFIVQRGSWDTKHNMWIGTTLIQVSNTEIPEGGSDDGNTIDPNWQDTGNTRCVKDGSGLNTGQAEKQQQDVNPASQSFGQTRWVDAGEDLAMCPIGEPDQYLWGAEPAIYDINNFSTSPVTVLTGGVLVYYSNDGGKYLYFLHLESLGLVTSVLDQRGSETISDWQYLADEVIGGFTYKVLRMNYVTTVYSGVPMTFVFN